MIKKIKGFFDKIINPIKRVCEEPIKFMRAGRTGAVLLISVFIAQLLYGTELYVFSGRMPGWLMFAVAVPVIILATELLCVLLKLFIGGVNRRKVYFWECFIFLLALNYIGNLKQCIVPAIVMSFAMVLSIDLLGGCIWAFVKTRKFRQTFGYVMIVLSGAYIVLFAIFIHKDGFGTSRIEFYLQGTSMVEATEVPGFEEYLGNGPYEVNVLDYGPEEGMDLVTETVDISYFVTRKGFSGVASDIITGCSLEEAPISGRIWYPDGVTDCPVMFIAHGNHEAKVPSYLGYDYLGEFLASNGYAVVSVDENVINGLYNENDARAVLLLENMKAIIEESDDKNSPVYNTINPDKIAIAGHSRGGEMVALAYLFNDLDVYPDNGNVEFDYHFNISSVIAIAPSVDQYMPGDHAVNIGDVNYLLIHGSNDQDVYNMMGEKQYNNVSFSADSEEQFVKASVYILGANHGQFNTRWGQYDLMPSCNGYLNTSDFLKASEQQLVAKAYIRVFLDMTLMSNNTFASLLSDHDMYLSYLPKTVYITNYSDSSFVNICSFDESVDLLSDYETGAEICCEDMSAWYAERLVRGNSEDENYVLRCRWKEERSPMIIIDIPTIDITDGAISFRIADMVEDYNNAQKLQYRIELTDTNGNTITSDTPTVIYPSLALQLIKQDVFVNNYEYKHQLQTVIADMNMFSLNSEFDCSAVCRITIYLDGTSAGEVILDDIGYY